MRCLRRSQTMWLLSSSLILLALGFGSCDTLTSEQDVQCPSLQVDEWKFPQKTRHNITGFNLVRRFSLLKSADVKKIRNPRGPIILRLGKTALLRRSETHQLGQPGVFYHSVQRCERQLT